MSAPPMAAPTGAAEQSRPAKADRRWLRIVVPVAVAFLIIGATLVVHATQQPSKTDPAYLSPTSTAGIGSATLVNQLSAEGVPVTVVHSGAEALSRAAAGGSTLVVPAPELVRPDLLLKLPELPPDVTVLLVRPSQLTVLELGLPVVVSTRWATRASHGCQGLPAGTRAATYRDHYATPGFLSADSPVQPTRDCFEHSVQGWHSPEHGEMVLVGADDIFRNNRVGELDNARVAASLFPAGHPVIWLDLHQQEKLHTTSSKPPKQKSPPRAGLPFPAWVKASAAGLALAALLTAIAAARRLGPPVPEPLPVPVRSTETALGRGRLYRRARARGAALQALRGDASTRLRTALAVPADAPPEALVAAVVAHTGLGPDVVRLALSGPEPEDDEQLRAAVHALDQLVHRVHPYPKEWS